MDQSTQIPYPVSSDPKALLGWAQSLVQMMRAPSAQAVPSGVIMPYSGVLEPQGWLICDGRLVKIDDQPGLFRTLGFRFNEDEDPEDSLRLPDGRGRTFVGTSSEIVTLYGGSSGATLSLENLPTIELTVEDPGHTHVFTGAPHTHGVTDPQHHHNLTGSFAQMGGNVNVGPGGTAIGTALAGAASTANAATGITVNNTTAGGTNANTQTGLTVTLEGGGEALEFLPPFFSGNWIIKT